MTRLGTAIVSLAGLALAAPPAAQSSPEGSWIVAGWTVNGQAAASPQRGLLIFTKTNYNIMFMHGNEPRANLGDSPTAEAKAAAFDGFTANAAGSRSTATRSRSRPTWPRTLTTWPFGPASALQAPAPTTSW